jgi:uncharacterized protein YdeI (YjbR/CyaY-like superfamily)
MNPVFFNTAADFKKWLEKNHAIEKEIWVGYYKTSSEKTGITWPQSVDEAISFGWIDGIRKSIDQESYCNRFTPRKANSNWSAINIEKAETLIRQGRMHASGLELYKNRKEDKSIVYSYENKPEKLPPEFEQLLMANEKAWQHFKSLPPSHQRTTFYWIMSAKQLSTQQSRLEKLIKASEQGKRL